MQPNIKDFEFIYEAQGTTFVFEDLCFESYIVGGEMLKYSNPNGTTLYFSKATMAAMNERGKATRAAELHEAIATLDELIAEVVRMIPGLATEAKITREQAANAFRLLSLICTKYAYFDFGYWDDTFKLSQTDAEAKEKVQLVQNNKNRFRAALEPVYFGNGYLPTFITKVSAQTGVSEEKLVWYRHGEVLELLDGKMVSEEEIAARKKAFVFHMDADMKLHFYSGEKAHSIITGFLASKVEEPAKVTVIKGKTAHSTGKIVTGKVRTITRDYGDPRVAQASMARMQEGEILVAQTTDPELMPAIRKAAAMVTDIGGLLSHSAITARELDIPCIIDTRNASKILKDGDLVEIDTDSGTVRIL